MRCEKKVEYCRQNLCENNGKCLEQESGFKCICKIGFIGRRCNILPCDYRPCSEHKYCVNIEVSNATRKSYR